MPRPVDVTHRIGGFRRPLGDLERAIAAVADAQHGVVSTEQLLALGLTHRMIERRVESGRLIRIHRGVYAVGRLTLTQKVAGRRRLLRSGLEPYSAISVQAGYG